MGATGDPPPPPNPLHRGGRLRVCVETVRPAAGLNQGVPDVSPFSLAGLLVCGSDPWDGALLESSWVGNLTTEMGEMFS